MKPWVLWEGTLREEGTRFRVVRSDRGLDVECRAVDCMGADRWSIVQDGDREAVFRAALEAIPAPPVAVTSPVAFEPELCTCIYCVTVRSAACARVRP